MTGVLNAYLFAKNSEVTVRSTSSHAYGLQLSAAIVVMVSLLIIVLAPSSLFAATKPSHLSQVLDKTDAVHLLNRTGIGAHPADIKQLVGLTRQQAVDHIISGIRTEATSPMPHWVDQSPIYQIRPSLDLEERRLFNKTRNEEFRQLKHWWLSEMIETRSPQTERLVLFWHNHFVSAYPAIGNRTTSIARQNALFRKLGGGSFVQLLQAIIRDAAMLEYLDNRNSHKKSPNENLARELMELFTLGEGNYSESDVKNAARALTGYTLAPAHNMQFRFDPQRHDHSKKTLFGQTGQFNGDDLVRIILEQPQAARFIAKRFWHFYMANDITDSDSQNPKVNRAIESLADKFRSSDYNISVLLRTLLESGEFWLQVNRHAIVKSPVDLVLGTMRSQGQPVSDLSAIGKALDKLGQQLFAAPNVAGWPGGGSWVTPGLLLQRLRWLEVYSRQAKKTLSESRSPSLDKSNTVSMASSMGNETQSLEIGEEANMMLAGETSKPKESDILPAADISARGVAVNKVYLHRVTNPNSSSAGKKSKKRANIVFTLLGVQVGKQYWNNIEFQISRRPDGMLTFMLDRYGCWPQCVKLWPDCAIKKKHDPYFRQIRLPVYQSRQSKAANGCDFKKLDDPSRQLMAALINSTEEFHTLTLDDGRLNNKARIAAHAAWGKYIQKNISSAVNLDGIKNALLQLKEHGMVQGRPQVRESQTNLDSDVLIYPASMVLSDLDHMSGVSLKSLLDPQYQLK